MKKPKEIKLQFMDLKTEGAWAHRSLISQFHKPHQAARPSLDIASKMVVALRRLGADTRGGK